MFLEYLLIALYKLLRVKDNLYNSKELKQQEQHITNLENAMREKKNEIGSIQTLLIHVSKFLPNHFQIISMLLPVVTREGLY